MEMATLRALLHAIAQTMRHPDPAGWADEVLNTHAQVLAADVELQNAGGKTDSGAEPPPQSEGAHD